MTKLLLVGLLAFFFISSGLAQSNVTISGEVKDKKTGEALIGAVVSVKGTKGVGGVSNDYGFYSLSLAPGEYIFVYQYVGYEKLELKVNLSKSLKQNVELAESSTELGEVKITGERQDRNVTQTEVVTKMDLKEIQSVPVLFGEKDILKTIQLLPGIKSAGEGNSGFYVRGGGADQNLVLLDEAPVYNASHLLGFFSTFNSDAIKDVEIYKSGFPAEYGGRLSSVLDIKMNNGNDKEYHVSGGVGLIASRLNIEGPIVKDKGSFLISARRTYADVFLLLSKDSVLNKSHLYFYDLNMKANYRLGDKDRVYFSGYFGRDNFGYSTNFGFEWGNATATARWNHTFSDKLFSNLSLIYSNYLYNIQIGSGTNDLTIKSSIEDWNVKEDLQYYINSNNTLKFGVNSIYHSFLPGSISTSATSSVNSQTLETKHALENNVYIQNEQSIGEHIKLNYGLRASLFATVGDYWKYTYYSDASTKDSTQANTTYFNIEPRISTNFIINDNSSVKASYCRTNQFLHLLSNSTTSSPTDLWIPSSNNVLPEVADQFALGYFKNFDDNNYETSAELYYKKMGNQIDYINGADLRLNKNVESQLVYGKGESYGIELLLKKKTGRLTGWISYTLSRTQRTFDFNDNKGPQTFNAKQDRTHDLSVVAMYEITKHLTFAGTWVFYTGNAVTFPHSYYVVDKKAIPQYPSRNADRMPNYHRLDLSLNWVNKKTAKFESSWNFSLYNAYGQENAYSISVQQSKDDPTKPELVQTSLFRWIPSVTYNFRF